MLALMLTLTACEGTTANPENLPDWAGLRSEALPIEGGGYLSLGESAIVWPDDLDWTRAETIATGLDVDIIDEDRAILTSQQFTPTPEDCAACGTSDGPCTDLARAVGDGWELTVCGESFVLGAAEPWPVGGE